MERLGQPGTDVDYKLLDEVINKAQQPTQEGQRCQMILQQFTERDDAIFFTEKMVDMPGLSNRCRFFGCYIMKKFVMDRWELMPLEHREPMKNFVAGHVVQWANSGDINSAELRELDVCLVMMIIRDWPQRWPGVVEELIGSSESSAGMCMNNMNILKMLSEEIMEFQGSQRVTSARISQLQARLKDISETIYSLIENVMTRTTDVGVIKSALGTMRAVVKWLDPKFIFETDLPVALCTSYMPQPDFIEPVLAIFGEIASLQNVPSQYENVYGPIFGAIVNALQQIVPQDFEGLRRVAMADKRFIETLIYSLSAYFGKFGEYIEKSSNRDQIGIALFWIVSIMKFSSNETDNFISCCEMWANIAKRAFVDNVALGDVYKPYFEQVRRVMIEKMARPEEIIMVEDEATGEMIKEKTRNSASLALYNIMKETMIYLTNLDPDDTMKAFNEFIELLQKEIADDSTRTQRVNALCWSAGAITGALAIQPERQFVITVLRVLLELNKVVSTIEDKAVVASGIMFVCSRYPRFLTDNWEFMKVVIDKLFEFIQHEVPAVREMAVNAFSTICEKSKRHFQIRHKGEPPMVEHFIETFESHVGNLDDNMKVQMFSAVALVISGSSDEGVMAMQTRALMERLNAQWAALLQSFNSQNMDCLRGALFILRCNAAVAEQVGGSFHVQLGVIFREMMMMYTECSHQTLQMFEAMQFQCMNHEMFKVYKGICTHILRLIAFFVGKTVNVQLITRDILPEVMNQVVQTYPALPPICRCSEVLQVVAAINSRVDQGMEPYVQPLLVNIFLPTCNMLSSDHTEFLDFRLDMISFLEALIKKCHRVLFSIPMEDFDVVEHMIEWGCENPDPEICKRNLVLLSTLFSTIETSAPQQFKNAFYKTCYARAINCAFVVLTDTVHKFAFTEEVNLIEKMLQLRIEYNTPENIAEILTAGVGRHDQGFFLSFLRRLNPGNHVEFRAVMRDFLVLVGQLSSSDVDLFAEEINQQKAVEEEQLAQIPGMSGPTGVENI